MPKHFRSAMAWRSAKPRKRARAAGIPGTAKAKAELFHRLGLAFDASPEVNDTPERTRERHIDAIDSVADYLEEIGVDAMLIKHFDELSAALEGPRNGAIPLVLGPAIPKI